MSLDGFQRALADFVASPQRCVALRHDAGLLDQYDLDAREQRRLLAMVRHVGMSHNCTLYRANRLTPIGRGLPRTCALLGARLNDELNRFWNEQPDTEIQFHSEAQRFADYLRRRLDAGALSNLPGSSGLLVDVLDQEREALDQRFTPVPH